VLRLLDANLNRSREGLRVLEDTARFVWEDEKLFKTLRNQRHSLDRITRSFYPQFVMSRDSAADSGRKMPEGGRKDAEAIVFANFRRCEESLRVLEEYGKVFPGGAAKIFKRIRFKVYDLEKKVLRDNLFSSKHG